MLIHLVQLHIVVFRQYEKKYCILHIAFIPSELATSNNCSELISFWFSFFFQNTRLFINRIFLSTFQIKIWKFSISNLIQTYAQSALNNCARAQLVCKQLIRWKEPFNLYKVNTKFHGYYEVRNDNAKRQFVDFIVGICRNTLKSFLSQFLWGKALWNFAQFLLLKARTKYHRVRYLSLRL